MQAQLGKLGIVLAIIIIVSGVGVYFVNDLSTPPVNDLPTSPAEFVVENMEISSDFGFVGKPITISADLVNIGGGPGEYSAELSFNGDLVENNQYVLDPNDKRRIELTATLEENGVVDVNLSGLTDNLRVFMSHPFVGEHVEYTMSGSAFLTPVSGSMSYDVTSISPEDYTINASSSVSGGGYSSLNGEVVVDIDEHPGISELELSEMPLVGTEILGTLEVLHYETSNSSGSSNMYVEKNTGLLVRVDASVPSMMSSFTMTLAGTNLDYFEYMEELYYSS